MLPSLPADVWPAGRLPPGGVRPPADTPAGAAGRRPVALVVEDAHWADEATLDLVRHLARRIHGCRALVMVSYRPEDAAAGRRAAAPAGRHRLRDRDPADRPAPLTAGGGRRPGRRAARGTRADADAQRAHRGHGRQRLLRHRGALGRHRPACRRPCATPCWRGSRAWTRPASGRSRSSRSPVPAPRSGCSSSCSRTAHCASTSRSPAGCCGRSTTTWSSGTSWPGSPSPARCRPGRTVHLHRRLLAALTRPRRRPGPARPPRRGRRRRGCGARPRARSPPPGRRRWVRTGRRCASTVARCAYADRLPPDDAGRAAAGPSATSAT